MRTSPLSISNYNSRFIIDEEEMSLYDNTFTYTNMVYHNFYGGLALQSQELNEIQEHCQNQMTLYNTFIGNWLQYNIDPEDAITQTSIHRSIIPVVPNTLTFHNIPKGWYLYESVGFSYYIYLPDIEYTEFTSPEEYIQTHLRKRTANSINSSWNLLKDATVDTLDDHGAHRSQIALDSSIIPSFDFRLPLFRFVDMDIYGFSVERNDDPNSIDNGFPFIPYLVGGESSWTSVGDINGMVNQMQTFPSGQGTNSMAFGGGALGALVDFSYHSGALGPTLPELRSNIMILDTNGIPPQINEECYMCGAESHDCTYDTSNIIGIIKNFDANILTLTFHTLENAENFTKNIILPNTLHGKISGTKLSFPSTLTFTDITSVPQNLRFYKTSLIPKSTQGIDNLISSYPLLSLYDMGDSSRKIGGDTQKLPKSQIHKYQWFDFETDTVHGSNLKSIASGFHGISIISKIPDINPNTQFIEMLFRKLNAPRGGYVQVNSETLSLWEILIKRPTVQQLEILNPHLVKTDSTTGVKYAQIRELWSNSLSDDYTSVVQTGEDVVELISIDGAVDQAIATLDQHGSIRILYCNDPGSSSSGLNASLIVYFDKEWIADGFLTDDTGQQVFIENKDFVQVCVSGGFGNHPLYVWCLHKSGKLYGAELTSAVEIIDDKSKPKEKFNIPGDPNSGISPLFGSRVNNTDLFLDKWMNPHGIVLPNSNSILENLFPKAITYYLNSIPKDDNNKRLPVIYITGGYGEWVCSVLCADSEYTGHIPSSREIFNHPIQMVCPVVFQLQISDASLVENEPQFKGYVGLKNGAFLRLQKYISTFNSTTSTWTYTRNPLFDPDLYKTIFGITITEADNITHTVYVPPRSFFTTNNDIHGLGIGFLGNNGNYARIESLRPAGSNFIVRKHSFSGTGATLSSNLTTTDLQNITNSNKITLNGSFNFGSSVFNIINTSPRSVLIYSKYKENQKTVTHHTISRNLNNNPLISFNGNTKHLAFVLGGDENTQELFCIDASRTGQSTIPINKYGELSSPLGVIGPAKRINKRIDKVCVGSNNTAVIFTDGTFRMWGSNVNNKLNNTDPDIRVKNIVFPGNPALSNTYNEMTILVTTNNSIKLLGDTIDPVYQVLQGMSDIIDVYASHNGPNAPAILIIKPNTDPVVMQIINPGLLNPNPPITDFINLDFTDAMFILYIKSDKTVHVWPEDNGFISPMIISNANIVDAKKVACTSNGALVLQEDGTVKFLSNGGGVEIMESEENQNIISSATHIIDIYGGYYHQGILVRQNEEVENSSISLQFLVGTNPSHTSYTIDFTSLPHSKFIGKWNNSTNNINVKKNWLIPQDTIDFNESTMFIDWSDFAFLNGGFGNPPTGLKTNIEREAAGKFAAGKFDYFNFFGNTAEELLYPESEIITRMPDALLYEKNYINDSHIVGVYAYRDFNNKLPIDIQNMNPPVYSYDSTYLRSNGYDMTILSVGNSTTINNPFVWMFGYGNGIVAIRQDGTIDIRGIRTTQFDHYVFDPFWCGVYPNSRLNANGITYEDNRPSNYEDILNKLKEIGTLQN